MCSVVRSEAHRALLSLGVVCGSTLLGLTGSGGFELSGFKAELTQTCVFGVWGLSMTMTISEKSRVDLPSSCCEYTAILGALRVCTWTPYSVDNVKPRRWEAPQGRIWTATLGWFVTGSYLWEALDPRDFRGKVDGQFGFRNT